MFEGLGKLHGRLEVLNHIWRPEAQNHKRRPNDFSGPWKNHLGCLRRHKISVRTFRFGYLFSVVAVPVRAVPVHSVPVRFMAFMFRVVGF